MNHNTGVITDVIYDKGGKFRTLSARQTTYAVLKLCQTKRRFPAHSVSVDLPSSGHLWYSKVHEKETMSL